MTKTEQLIQELDVTVKSGLDSMVFMVGRYKYYTVSCVNALRRRGYTVDKIAQETYRVFPKK